MTKISLSDLAHLASLSGLDLTDEEKEILRNDVERIISYLTELKELDTTGVEPAYQVTELENVWREDKVDDTDVTRGQLLGLAPEQAENQIKVPKVL